MYEINMFVGSVFAWVAINTRSKIKHIKQKDIQREMQIKNMDEAFRLRIETTPHHRHSLCHHTNPDRN